MFVQRFFEPGARSSIAACRAAGLSLTEDVHAPQVAGT
jgi:hypothetical protein